MAVGHFAGFFMDRLFERIFDVFWEGLGLRGETGSGRASVGDMLIGQLNEKRWDELLGKFEKLKQLMLILGSVIEEVKGRQVTNESFLQWLGELIEGMYQGQYMLDTMEFQSNNSSSRFNHKSFDELQCVVKKLCDLESNVAIFLKILKHCRPLGGSVTYYLNMNDDRMFGRDLEKVQMINFLQSEELGDSGNVRILSITGGEGHGKTTLAAYFYNEIWVRNRFSLSVWLDGACLQDPTIFFGKLLDHLPSSSSATSVDAEQFVPLGETVKKRLRNEMFLLVIDNAHYLNMAIWSIVKDCLKSGKRGSKLIITSRMDEVIQVGTVESITLDAMRKGEYCCFFKNLVFGRNCPEEYVRLTMIAKEIASMLNGSPLAAKAMAARLKENISIQHWENILKTLNPVRQSNSLIFNFLKY